MTNEELISQAVDTIKKSMITTTDLASAGKLNPAQVERFIDFVIDVTSLKNNVRVVRFRNESMYIDKIGVGTRVSVLAVEATDPSLRRGVSTSRITLTPVEVMTPFEITDNFKEINVEGDSVETTIVRMMATQTANDLEEQMLNGDALGHARLQSDLVDNGDTTKYVKDTYMGAYDGWLRLADSANIYDAAGANISSTVFSRMLMALPIKFRRNRRDMRFLVSLDHEQLYLEKLASRATGVGDAVLQGDSIARPFGVPLVGVPLLESEPLCVEHKTLAAFPSTVTLRYAPIGTDVVVTLATLAGVPTTPYIETTDYVVDRTNGTITNTVGGALNGGATVKITYNSRGQLLFTNFMNLIFAIGRDMTLERGRDMFKRVNQFAITTKIDVEIEETTALVKGINVGIN